MKDLNKYSRPMALCSYARFLKDAAEDFTSLILHAKALGEDDMCEHFQEVRDFLCNYRNEIWEKYKNAHDEVKTDKTYLFYKKPLHDDDDEDD